MVFTTIFGGVHRSISGSCGAWLRMTSGGASGWIRICCLGASFARSAATDGMEAALAAAAGAAGELEPCCVAPEFLPLATCFGGGGGSSGGAFRILTA